MAGDRRREGKRDTGAGGKKEGGRDGGRGKR